MRLPLKALVLVALPLATLGACTTLSEQDRALIASANQNAQQAKDLAQQALNAAQAAQASSSAAAQSATQAASDAKAANEKADRMFQRSLRKTFEMSRGLPPSPPRNGMGRAAGDVPRRFLHARGQGARRGRSRYEKA